MTLEEKKKKIQQLQEEIALEEVEDIGEDVEDLSDSESSEDFVETAIEDGELIDGTTDAEKVDVEEELVNDMQNVESVDTSIGDIGILETLVNTLIARVTQLEQLVKVVEVEDIAEDIIQERMWHEW